MSKHRRWSWSFALWGWVFLLAGIAPLLPTPRASAAEESDPYPNSENTKSNLDIYYPQDGPMVLEDKEYIEGSFTVVNKNDTNGNGQPDVDDDDMSATGEVDLMKLVASTPTVTTPTKNAILTVKKGNIKLWATKNKQTEINLDANNQLTIPPAQLPKTMWIEARETDDTKLALHDIEIELEYDGVKDTVRATSVWSKRSNFWNTAKAGNPKTLNGEEDDLTILNSFTTLLGSDLGMGPFPIGIGGREEQEFVMYPPGIGAYVGPDKPVVVDMSRQGSWRLYEIHSGVGAQNPSDTQDFPPAGPNQFELATDDIDVPPNDPIDEDDVPVAGSDKIYQIDAPLAPKTFNKDFLMGRFSFKEFARFKFGPNKSFIKPNNTVDGSRGSPLEPWHCLVYAKRAQKALGLDGTYVQDNANPSASFAVPADANTGNGTCESTPNADNAVTEGWTVVYNAGADSWAVTGSDGTSGTLSKAGNTWTGTASLGGNVRISITVTAGGTAFATGDTFKFSTFKSTATDGKKFEIETGPCTITDGP